MNTNKLSILVQAILVQAILVQRYSCAPDIINYIKYGTVYTRYARCTAKYTIV